MLNYVTAEDIKDRIAFYFMVRNRDAVLLTTAGELQIPVLALRQKNENWAAIVLVTPIAELFLWQIRLTGKDLEYVDTLLAQACAEIGLNHEPIGVD